MTQKERLAVERALAWLTPVCNEPEFAARQRLARVELRTILEENVENYLAEPHP